MIDKIIQGDSLEVLKTLEDESVQTCVTSPPYFGLRDYGVTGQIGLEETPEAYVQKLVEVFREVRRVLRKDGTLWLNLGDSYTAHGTGGNTYKTTDDKPKEMGEKLFGGGIKRTMPDGLKPKDLIGIPWRVAFALQADGWYLRQDIIWHKPNPMPESVTDRCTKAHEYIFLLSKNQHYYFDNEAIKEAAVTHEDRPAGVVRDREYGYDSKQKVLRAQRGYTANAYSTPQSAQRGSKSNFGDYPTRNRRSVWTVITKPYKGAHFATFPPDLITPCVLAGAPRGGIVLDPFFGSGTTGAVAKQHGRRYLGIELNPDYIKLAEARLDITPTPLF